MAKVKVRYTKGWDISLQEFMEELGNILLGDGTQNSSSKVTIRYDDTVTILTGSGININGRGAGTVDTWKTSVDGKLAVTISNADFSVRSLISAIKGEDSGSDIRAFEKYFLKNFSWNYVGNDVADIARPGDKTSDGYPVDFEGADVFDLRGGADKVGGGRGNDLLKGGDGKDQLWGEEGKDKLFGQAGNDRLWGGDANDLLDGGASNDALWGGGGNDKFRFVKAFGRDVVKDFGDGDVLDLRKTAAPGGFNKLMKSADDTRAGLVLDLDGGRILLAGVEKADLDASDVLL
ncbi:Hemolysin-type calcium-binding repeat-containing protein [Albimonas pacifica]|uniref:Hemolysin-type calcium-binding repeat-containing protein n=2 Tax=Albimonas pacifica TaxID=1114924 RepID=A0A1I3LYR3_9RHOB|nr:Hemolysin-type calcium-binding repeat-containing protein [Albimonas pacifica]